MSSMATRFSCHSMLSTPRCFAALRSIAMYSYSTLPQSSSCVIHSFLRMWQTLLSALLSYTDLSLSHITFAESLISKCARTSAVVAMYILDLVWTLLSSEESVELSCGTFTTLHSPSISRYACIDLVQSQSDKLSDPVNFWIDWYPAPLYICRPRGCHADVFLDYIAIALVTYFSYLFTLALFSR